MTGDEGKKATYRPDIFEVDSIEEAKQIILTPEDGFTSEERWNRETPILSQDISGILEPRVDSTVVDYGCGIGRLAKELLALHDISIVGVDISTRMRAFAHLYVEHSQFSCSSRNGLLSLVRHGFRADHGYVVWVLQHSAEPEDDIDLLWQVLKPGGSLLVVNLEHRLVPTDNGWMNDGIDVATLLEKRFSKFKPLTLSRGAIIDKAVEFTFCKLYTK